MRTRQEKTLLALCGFLLVCLVLSVYAATLQGRETRYEVRPEVTLPERTTDIDRVMDSYDRLVDSYILMTENNMAGLRSGMTEVSLKLNRLDEKITELSRQIDTIQNKLGIDAASKPEREIVDEGKTPTL